MRADIHRPSSISPEQYMFLGIWYDPNAKDEVGGLAMLVEEQEHIRRFMEKHRARFANHEHGGTCMCCGAHALYLAAFWHEVSNEVILVGQDCAFKLDLGCESAFNAARRMVSSAKDYATGKARAKVLLTDRNLLRAWDIWEAKRGVDSDHSIVIDMVTKLINYGDLSDKQWQFLLRLMYRIDHRAEYEAQKALEKSQAMDCPSGRVVITGTVLSVKKYDDFYGVRFKMLIKAEGGYTVFGTIPKGLEVRSGDTVSIRATVTPSETDSKHGYFSRPSAQKN